MLTTYAEQSGAMRDSEGREVRERRLRLGMTIEELADEAGVSADTLSDFEAGNRKPRQLTVSKVVSALGRIEEETGVDAPAPQSQEPHVVTFDVSVEGGFHVVVSGPVADAATLREQVSEIIREMRTRKSD